MREYHCHVRRFHGGKFRTAYSPTGALAAWDTIQIRCKKLHEDFYAAKCKTLNCNLEKFKMIKPDSVSIRSYPIFEYKHLTGMPDRVKVLIPVACFCQVQN